jgi:hypothetical protein
MRIRLPAAAAAIPPIVSMLAACASYDPAPRADLLGMQVAPTAATQTVTITPATRWVNVTANDVVRFVVDGQEFGWAFNTGPTVRVFDLNRVAPPGLLGRELLVYVDPDPGYYAGGSWRAPAR